MGSLSWPIAPVISLEQLRHFRPGSQVSFFFSTDESRCSIVAVLGLGDDAYDTWEDEINIWLRDFVPSQIPSARVMSFGHDSFIAFSKSVAGIEDLAADLLNRLNIATKNAVMKPVLPFSCALTPPRYRN